MADRDMLRTEKQTTESGLSSGLIAQADISRFQNEGVLGLFLVGCLCPSRPWEQTTLTPMSRQSNVTNKSDLSATGPRGKKTISACKLYPFGGGV